MTLLISKRRPQDSRSCPDPTGDPGILLRQKPQQLNRNLPAKELTRDAVAEGIRDKYSSVSTDVDSSGRQSGANPTENVGAVIIPSIEPSTMI